VNGPGATAAFPGPECPGCWPAFQALRSACDPRSAGPGSPDAVTEPFGVLIEQAITAKLTCMLADWLTRDGRAARLPRTMRDFLQTQLRAGRHRWRLHHRETARVIAALDEQGIPAAAVNGIATASLLYDGRGTRQYTDADILVPPGATGTATRILAGLGYAPAGGTGALRRDLGDPVVPGLTVDLTSRLAHADSTTAAAALARRVPAPAWADAPQPLPVLARSDGFAHTLARLAARPRWPGLADALRYALSSDAAIPAAASTLSPSPAAAAGWELVLRCWPELPARPPLTGPASPGTP
jgi:hypothetical protein